MWTDPIPGDALAMDKSTQEQIILRNNRHWQNSSDYANHFMSEPEFQECALMGQDLETDSPKMEGPELETFYYAFQRLQEMYQARELMGLLPVHLRKDPTVPKQEYYPSDLATLTLNTTHEQRSRDKGIAELQHVPNVMKLISALLHIWRKDK